ncbi:FMN-dependent NADH-azoreductase [Kushneria phyllosphaerae]|uniref:FMN dependent NADH:quinone oxidoreductase n=1 Tax=Kushneria phyllosphaerae TaxID=2100822 RepID=A0A2R8CI97_9GAMM|nr:NAD(P)H-dependent oxidoreductase [Kushneria phyllosphaerae]SPJ32627.1 FMN-dependent NADH-azoreductase 1 [Kushneria phyllosphaerae]
MTSILRISASARRTRSLTRMQGDLFMECWNEIGPETSLVVRDVGLNPPAIISEDWIAAAFRPPSERSKKDIELLAESNHLIEELEQADLILVTTPMYNYGMPAALKAWVDQVVRVGRTFTFDLARGDRPLAPTLSGKTLVLLTASGEFGFAAGELNEGAGHLLPHLQSVAKYLGATDIHHIGIEYQEFCDTRFENSRANAIKAIRQLALQLSSTIK